MVDAVVALAESPSSRRIPGSRALGPRPFLSSEAGDAAGLLLAPAHPAVDRHHQGDDAVDALAVLPAVRLHRLDVVGIVPLDLHRVSVPARHRIAAVVEL